MWKITKGFNLYIILKRVMVLNSMLFLHKINTRLSPTLIIPWTIIKNEIRERAIIKKMEK
jgi:hypothetical protein